VCIFLQFMNLKGKTATVLTVIRIQTDAAKTRKPCSSKKMHTDPKFPDEARNLCNALVNPKLTVKVRPILISVSRWITDWIHFPDKGHDDGAISAIRNAWVHIFTERPQ
jgi:hypothetical protein